MRVIQTPLTAAEQRALDFLAFDALPRAVRFRISEMTINISSESAYRAARRMGPSLAGVQAQLANLDRAEGKEMLAFAREHRHEHGYWLPHLSAEVSVQRYGPLNGQECRLVRGRWMRQRRLAA
jgi:hypothetical protein